MLKMNLKKNSLNWWIILLLSPEYGDKVKLCYTDTDSFIIYIKIEDLFEDISNDVEKWFDTSNYDKMIKDLFQ